MMVRSFAWVLPSLVVGGLAGFLYARALAPDTREAGAAADAKGRDPRPVVNVTEKWAAARGHALSERRGESAVRRGAISGEVELTEEERIEVYAVLERIEELSTEHGVWSRLAGFKAQAVLARLPDDESKIFEERIDAKIRSGALRPQTGAWLPGQRVN